MLLYGSRGRAGVTAFAPGDAAYYPRGFGHAIMNVGDEDLVIVQTWNSGTFEEIRLHDLLKASPRHLLATDFPAVPPSVLDRLKTD